MLDRCSFFNSHTYGHSGYTLVHGILNCFLQVRQKLSKYFLKNGGSAGSLQAGVVERVRTQAFPFHIPFNSFFIHYLITGKCTTCLLTVSLNNSHSKKYQQLCILHFTVVHTKSLVMICGWMFLHSVNLAMLSTVTTKELAPWRRVLNKLILIR